MNYSVSASITTPFNFVYSPGEDEILTAVPSYDNVINNSLNYFNISTGLYTLGNTPNIPLNCTEAV